MFQLVLLPLLLTVAQACTGNNTCSGHGVCQPAGYCQCDLGYFDSDCQTFWKDQASWFIAEQAIAQSLAALQFLVCLWRLVVLNWPEKPAHTATLPLPAGVVRPHEQHSHGHCCSPSALLNTNNGVLAAIAAGDVALFSVWLDFRRFRGELTPSATFSLQLIASYCFLTATVLTCRMFVKIQMAFHPPSRKALRALDINAFVALPLWLLISIIVQETVHSLFIVQLVSLTPSGIEIIGLAAALSYYVNRVLLPLISGQFAERGSEFHRSVLRLRNLMLGMYSASWGVVIFLVVWSVEGGEPLSVPAAVFSELPAALLEMFAVTGLLYMAGRNRPHRTSVVAPAPAQREASNDGARRAAAASRATPSITGQRHQDQRHTLQDGRKQEPATPLQLS